MGSPDQIYLGVQQFHESPLAAVAGCQKSAVRTLGGTLSIDGTALKRVLRESGHTAMEDALLNPNYVIFYLQTCDNIAVALSQGKLAFDSRNKIYHLSQQVCPFAPAIENTWRISISFLDVLII